MTTYYKVLNEDGTSCHGGTGKWPLPQDGKPGGWLSVQGKLVPCQNGLHICRLDQLIDWLGPAIYEVEALPGADCIEASDKVVVRKARLVRRIQNWNERTARLFACDCAERELDRISHSDPRSIEAIAVARAYARGEATAEELADARNAALAAARDAARAAAWATASYAAWHAARAAARTAAWVAAREAWGAAVAASDAARNAAWDAVSDARNASDVAVFAALDAERAWQTERLRQYLSGEVTE